ncbi:MAG TPA: amidohydrolase family protein [Anaeromyxobacteraceae bacterium]|nr:amidohydrolase family protein [Anaeromyxobacteraceae bacterium]
MAVRVVAAPWVLLGAPPAGVPAVPPEGAALRDGAVALQGGRVLAVGPRAEVEARHGPAEPWDAVLLPALANAHLHLELSHLAGRVPGGEGLAPWILRLVAERARAPAEPGDAAMARGVEALEAAGVAAVGEVSNTLASLAALGWAGFAGTVYHEVFGFSDERAEAALRAASEARATATTGPTSLGVALSPHALYSTNPRLLQRLLRQGPASIHLAEDPAERLFAARGEGPLCAIARQLGAGDADLGSRSRSAVAAVAPFLGPRSLAVHGVDLDDQDLADLRRSGATVVLCPRSNLHIGGRLPDLPRLLDAGIPLAVGTDSLASSPSLSPLEELAALRRAYRQIPAARLLPLAWNGAAVGAPALGRLAEGTAPGLLAAPLDGERPADPFAWLLDTAGRRLAWVARHRLEVRP